MKTVIEKCGELEQADLDHLSPEAQEKAAAKRARKNSKSKEMKIEVKRLVQYFTNEVYVNKREHVVVSALLPPPILSPSPSRLCLCVNDK